MEEDHNDSTGRACTRCGEPLEYGAFFCDDCGAKIEQFSPEPLPLPRAATTAKLPDLQGNALQCPQCQSALRPGKKFCGACGASAGKAPVPHQEIDLEELKCTKCGEPLEQDALFCVDCGSPAEQDIIDKRPLPSGKPTKRLSPGDENAVICPKCKKIVRKGKKFCGGCGAPAGPDRHISLQLQEEPAALPPGLSTPENNGPTLKEPVCPGCRARVTEDSEFCGSCGTNLKSSSEAKKALPFPCAFCKAPLDADSTFCANCGKKVEKPGAVMVSRDMAGPVTTPPHAAAPEGENRPADVEKLAVPLPAAAPVGTAQSAPVSKSLKRDDRHRASAGDTRPRKHSWAIAAVFILVIVWCTLKITSPIKPPDPPVVTEPPVSVTLPVNADRDKEEACRVVLDNYKAVEAKDYEKILSLRSSRVRKGKSVRSYEGIYYNNISITIRKISPAECSDNMITLDIDLVSEDYVIDGEGKMTDDTLSREYRGWFKLIRENGAWVIDDSHMPEVKP